MNSPEIKRTTGWIDTTVIVTENGGICFTDGVENFPLNTNTYPGKSIKSILENYALKDTPIKARVDVDGTVIDFSSEGDDHEFSDPELLAAMEETGAGVLGALED